MSIEDLIAKYGCGGGAEEVEDNVDESETEVEDEGMTCIFIFLEKLDVACLSLNIL